MKCLAAFTPPGSQFPPYTNFTLLDGDKVRVTVRGPLRYKHSDLGSYAVSGAEAVHEMTLDEFRALLAEAQAALS